MKAIIGLSILLITSASFSAEACGKSDSSKEMDACFQSQGLKWAFDPIKNLSVEKIRKGPSYKPGLAAAEAESGVVFCQYFYHKFSSPGSAKFLCGRTTAEGVLLDDKGQPVPEARSISTREMNLQIQINGEVKNVGEGVLLDSTGQPIVRSKENGRQELVEADELKVKYFVDREHYDDSQVQRGSYQINFGGRTVQLQNAFVGPAEISNPRWREVFTEVAATRLFWALGLPADIMVPMKQVVCFGCNSHPNNQRNVEAGKVSVFNTVVLEKKFKGTKLNEQFNFNRVNGKFYPRWSEETQHEYEAMALAFQLIAYHHPIALQNRMQCADGQYDKNSNHCKVPVPFAQDVGSSFAGKTKSEGGRGVLAAYQQGKVFSDASTCSLYYPVGSDAGRFREAMDGPSLKHISTAGLEKFKTRMAGLTPEVVREIFAVSRFGDIDPNLRNSAPGATIDEKRNHMIHLWSQSLLRRIQEIQSASNCQAPRPSFSHDDPFRNPASTEKDSEKKSKKKEIKKVFKNVSVEFRNEAIRQARVTSPNYDASTISSKDLISELESICGPQFKYEKTISQAGFPIFQWPKVECQYVPEDSFNGASTKFKCEFENSKSKDGKTSRKVKYMSNLSKPFENTDLVESMFLNTTAKALGFFSETYCPAEIVCKNCPSQHPWAQEKSSVSAGTETFTFPMAVVEFPLDVQQITNPGPHKLPQGLNWDELKEVRAKTPELEKQMRIEREAWLLWINFIQHWDADAHNQRISCVNARLDSNGNPTCDGTVAYTHDYGRSFYRGVQFNTWAGTPVFRKNGDGDFECRNTLRRDILNGRPGPGIIMQPVISAEARDLLVSRMARLTDDQWISLLQISKLPQASKVSPDRWLRTIKNKIQEMAGAQCLSFDSGTSVLGVKAR